MDIKKILIVDDEVDFTRLLRFRLEAFGFFVISAANGEEAIERAKKDKPDLVLLDIMMPKMDGYAALKILKENKGTRNIPVVMLTCKEKKEAAEAPGKIEGYIVKPYEKEDLLNTIEKALER